MWKTASAITNVITATPIAGHAATPIAITAMFALQFGQATVSSARLSRVLIFARHSMKLSRMIATSYRPSAGCTPDSLLGL